LTALAVPTIVSVGNVRPTSITVSWDPIPGASRYTAYAIPQSGGANTSNTVIGMTSTLSDLSPGQAYDIVVTATFPAGTGSPSSPVSQFTGIFCLTHALIFVTIRTHLEYVI